MRGLNFKGLFTAQPADDSMPGVVGLFKTEKATHYVKAENDDLKRQLAAAEIALQQQRALADRIPIAFRLNLFSAIRRIVDIVHASAQAALRPAPDYSGHQD